MTPRTALPHPSQSPKLSSLLWQDLHLNFSSSSGWLKKSWFGFSLMGKRVASGGKGREQETHESGEEVERREP